MKTLCMVLVFELVIQLQAQEVRPTAKRSPTSASGALRVSTSAVVPFSGAIAGKARCDDEGNVYARLVDKETSKNAYASTLPLQKIKRDGTMVTSHSAREISPDLRVTDFFVSGDGKVFEAARSDSEGNVYVVSSFSGTSPRKALRLETDFFIPYQIAVFKTGEFLLSGILGPHNRTPFTAVFDSTGKVIGKIYESEDEDARKRAEAGEADFRPDSTDYGNDFVTHGDAALGSDGNVYLLRAGPRGLIYVISNTGQVLRKLSVASPSSGLIAKRLKSLPGKLAVVFLQKQMNQGVIHIIDYKGQPIADYATDDSRMYPGLMGCYDSQGFTFLAVDDDGGIHVHRAEPE